MNGIPQTLASQESRLTSSATRRALHSSTLNFIWIALVAISLTIAADFLKAQTSYGSVVGTVMDPGGALVSGAHVQLTNKGTNAEQTVITGTAGTYTFINLIPGAYSITVTSQGFKAATNELVVVSIGGAT